MLGHSDEQTFTLVGGGTGNKQTPKITLITNRKGTNRKVWGGSTLARQFREGPEFCLTPEESGGTSPGKTWGKSFLG